MSLTGACVYLAAALACTIAQVAAQQRPVDTFRSGREVLTIDTAVRDADGRPVTDLQASEFTVRIDGQPRTVVAARLYGTDAGRVTGGAAPLPRFVRSADAAPGRIVVFAVDRESIKSGSERAALETSARLLDQLSLADAVAAISLPVGGIDLTRDHAAVADALRLMTGTAQNPGWEHALSWEEALAYERNDTVQIRQVVARECEPSRYSGFEPCSPALQRQAREMLMMGRGHAQTVLTRLTDVVRRLAPLAAPKHLVLISGGLAFDSELLSRYREFAAKAAEAHVALFVVHLDQPSFDASGRVKGADIAGRDFATGLGTIAASTGGEFFGGVGRATGVFERIATGINYFYELGIESRPADADGKPHRVDVSVTRPGLHVRAPAATAAVPRTRDASATVAGALAQPTDLAELPLEVATYAMHSADPAKVRVVIAATLAGPSEKPPVGWGYVIMDGARTVGGTEIRVDPAAERPWSATASVEIPPGGYRLRTAVVGADGRVATLDLPLVAALRAAGTARASELMIGVAVEGRLQPRSRVGQDQPAIAMIELSSAEPVTGAGGTIELIRAGTAVPVSRTPVVLRPREQDNSVVIAEAALDLSALSPGSYTASAILQREGTPVARVSRVFEVAPAVGPPAVASSTPSPAASVAAAALDGVLQRVGRYVAEYGQQASVIIGAERYNQRYQNAPLGQPSARSLVSEFALVKTNDTTGWVGFRDVIEADGKRVGDRHLRLQLLFETATPDVAEARRIRDESARFNIGPAHRNFNDPMTALFFFLPVFQPRFSYTKKGETALDGTNVWEIDFKEKASPTLIRTSQGRDVASRGTIWVNPQDGTVVRTKLVVSGFAGPTSLSSVDVTFARDSRLGLWLPSTMNERNQGRVNTGRGRVMSTATTDAIMTATAIYSDFKRFETTATIK